MRYTINRTAAVATFFPATLLPIIGLGAAGLYKDASLLDCITFLINSRNYVLAFAVFMITVATPEVGVNKIFQSAEQGQLFKLAPNVDENWQT
ncbi:MULTISPECIES: paraquat-inducible protein A [unclassified Colwellia]|uniref:paraquat-inducible protein A n=1 Tax=unclassified Colwellia TaxID=196834 RepID=UPI0015F3545F|nr:MULTISPECIES: paraquat-inducible protein A [unclassified Colwellia]MBA6231145.1 paraquat-inducible protein A [Colwellia sp. MB02u-7]MBA6235086.1 paraquat-inducible protein A [Colwellia sp. MB02u-11]MBA6257530.1 paraquat-inducible protein A [Colwellia sp. MB3u-28]MBA6260602.1 paraquat-inducible protein A [Colwellia sp. MB3u-41]MBA6301705.1 paraquat-inducible protein A [Colwellia sp. MB3u-22]